MEVHTLSLKRNTTDLSECCYDQIFRGRDGIRHNEAGDFMISVEGSRNEKHPTRIFQFHKKLKFNIVNL